MTLQILAGFILGVAVATLIYEFNLRALNRAINKRLAEIAFEPEYKGRR